MAGLRTPRTEYVAPFSSFALALAAPSMTCAFVTSLPSADAKKPVHKFSVLIKHGDQRTGWPAHGGEFLYVEYDHSLLRWWGGVRIDNTSRGEAVGDLCGSAEDVSVAPKQSM